MKAVTGVVVDLEGGNLQITKGDHDQLGYLEGNIEGGGVLRELEHNRGTLKAKLRGPDDRIETVSVPSPNVIKPSDVVTVVKDEDGCEFYYVNHSSERSWGFGRCPARERRIARWARMAISWGLSLGLGAGILAALSRGQSMGLNMTAVCLIGAAICSMVWILTGRVHAAKRHLRLAEDLVASETSRQATFIKSPIETALGQRDS